MMCCKSACCTIPAWQVNWKLPNCVPSDSAFYLPSYHLLSELENARCCLNKIKHLAPCALRNGG